MHSVLFAFVTVPVVSVALTACGQASTPVASPPVTVTNTVTVSVPNSAISSQPGQAASADAATSWVMPDLTGNNLQFAQDEIQRITDNAIFYTASKDLTGKERHQMFDRNWQVCNSIPPSGATITTGTSITFGVVRIDTEACP